jgi:hypothetical protein
MLGLVARERFVDQAFDGRPVLQPRAIRGKARVLRPFGMAEDLGIII